jgi:hypothetical protein
MLLVLKDEEGRLRFLVHPEWRGIIRAKDMGYFESLFHDLLKRAKLHPDTLFEHLCSLVVGPLVTREVGSNLEDSPPISQLTVRFIDLITTIAAERIINESEELHF